jgi:hypothetical protein
MKNKLFEAPISDYLPDEFKQKSKESALSRVREKSASSSKFMRAMSNAPSKEGGDKKKLVRLALRSLFNIYPDLKTAVDEGFVVIDADLSTGGGGRITTQRISPSEIERVKEKYPQFGELKKKRDYINALTQGKSWDTGFNYIYALRDQLDSINPELYDDYVDFIEGASDYYWNNTEMLERMASQATGRIAYVDVTREDDGVVKIEARAPLFPLLLHELVKGAEYFRSSFSLPKEKELRQTLLKVTDTHKSEIQNMNYGRSIVRKLREFLSDNVKGYEPYMEVHIVTELESLPENEFNEIMDGFLRDDDKAFKKLKRISEDVINELE